MKIFDILHKMPIITRNIKIDDKTGSIVVNLLSKFTSIDDQIKSIIESTVNEIAKNSDYSNVYDLIEDKKLIEELKLINNLVDSSAKDENDVVALKLKNFLVDNNCITPEGEVVCPCCGDHLVQIR